MKKLSALVDPRQDPDVSRGQLATVTRSFDLLVMRLIWSVSPETTSAPETDRLNEELERTHKWCMDSLATTGTTLAACQPVPIAPPGDQLFDATDSAAAIAAYYRSLADAIVDCQRELNTVNWKRWTQSYF
jgi:hypothetical protein